MSMPQMLLQHNLKALRLPTMLAEYAKLSREAADADESLLFELGSSSLTIRPLPRRENARLGRHSTIRVDRARNLRLFISSGKRNLPLRNADGPAAAAGSAGDCLARQARSYSAATAGKRRRSRPGPFSDRWRAAFFGRSRGSSGAAQTIGDEAAPRRRRERAALPGGQGDRHEPSQDEARPDRPRGMARRRRGFPIRDRRPALADAARGAVRRPLPLSRPDRRGGQTHAVERRRAVAIANRLKRHPGSARAKARLARGRRRVTSMKQRITIHFVGGLLALALVGAAPPPP